MKSGNIYDIGKLPPQNALPSNKTPTQSPTYPTPPQSPTYPTPPSSSSLQPNPQPPSQVFLFGFNYMNV